MWLQALTVRGFRNLRTPSLAFDARANYLFGPNAAGKTSLLEAIHYLAIGRSFRPAQDKDVIQFGAEIYQLQGEAQEAKDTDERRTQNTEHRIQGMEYGAQNLRSRTGEIRGDGKAKKLFLDGVEVERLSSYLGWLPVVTLLLDDIRLIRGGPGERRGFLDLALSKVSKPYLMALAEYRRVLVRRNRVLTQSPGETLLSTWDEQLVTAGVEVFRLRNTFVPELLNTAGEIAATLFNVESSGRGPGAVSLQFTYRPSVKQDADTRGHFLAALRRHRAREQALGVTLSGPHRDDIIIEKIPNPEPSTGSAPPEEPQSAIHNPQSSFELRRFGSEGEQRSASIALKLAEARLIERQRHDAPVFLLDEIASELDPERSQRLFALLESHGQIFYAAAKPIPVKGKVFNVEAGEIREA